MQVSTVWAPVEQVGWGGLLEHKRRDILNVKEKRWVLFTIARTWEQPKCPSTDEWIMQVVHIYPGILLSHKKE